MALVIVFAAALAVRVMHVLQMRDTLFFSVLMGDSRGYDAWAQQIAAGNWLGTEVFYQAPLYPYFLGTTYALFGHDLLAVRLIQAVLGAVSCVAVGYAAARLISRRGGLVAGLMLAFYPPAIFFDGLIQKSVLDVLFVCLSLAAVARIVERGGARRLWLLLGISTGLLALTRENALVLAAVLVVWSATGAEAPWAGTKVARAKAPTNAFGPTGTEGRGFSLGRRRFSLGRPALLLGGVAVVLAPVAARNYAVGGGFHLTTSQFGSNLYIGNNPRADGSYVALRDGRGSPEFERLDATALAEQASGRSLTAAEVSRYWTAQTLAYVRSQPADWLRLLARKAQLLLSSTEVVDTESQESHAEHSLSLRLLGEVWHFGVLLPLAVVGMFVMWPNRRRLWPVYALAAAYALSVVFFYVVARYRLPLVPFIVLFAAAGVIVLLERWSLVTGGPRVRIRSAVLAAAAIAALANWPLHSAANQQAITENNLGAALQEAGRTGEAIERYRRALTLNPAYTPAMNNLGTALRAAGRADEAIAAYDQALARGVDRASIHLNRGNALMSQGRLTDAIAAFRLAVALEPQSPRATTTLANALYDFGTSAIATGAFERASAALSEAIALKPDYAEAHNNLGIALASQGKLDEAIAHWETALRLAPDFADARRNLEMAQRRR